MESGRGKARMNVQGDRLSNLPDDLIHKILSLVGTKLAVQTSVLSSRWRYLWTSLPCLDFSSGDFKRLPMFSNFVTHVLSCRNNQIDISSAKLNFRGKACQAFLTKILNYVFSHNAKQLTISWMPSDRKIKIPLSLFGSQSLEHLTIDGQYVSRVMLTSTWELTSLITLHLECITFNDEFTSIFSKCANLKKLLLRNCCMKKSNGVDICHPRLSNLTLENNREFKNVINVVAPQLKDLAVSYWQGLHLSLCPCDLKVHRVKYLTLNVEMFHLLSPLMELISYQPSPFVNLKSLKVYPKDLFLKVRPTIPAEVQKYLLDGSPSATFTQVSYEEMKALENAASALNCIRELGVMLELEKANIETNIAHLDQVMASMECHEPNMHEQDNVQINKGEMRNQIDSCWKDLSAQIGHGRAKTSSILSKLCRIGELMTELPASRRAQIEASFSRLCTEADIVMNAIMNSIKIQSDEKQSSLSVYFHDLATAVKPSFTQN